MRTGEGSAQRSRVCFLGGMRYSRPLDATQEKKWRLLAKAGEMFVVAFSENWQPRCFTQHAHFYLLPKFPVPMLRYLLVFGVGTVLALWTIFRYGVRILVAQSPYEGLGTAVAKQVAGRLGRRVTLIVENHGDFEVSLFLQRRVFFPALYRLLMHRAAHFSLIHADLLRAVSDSTRKQLELWVPSKRVVQFPTWTDLDVFLQAGAREAERHPGLVLHAGVLIPRKGVHHLVNAFRSLACQFASARLVLAGGADNPAYAADLKKQVRRLGLDGRVEVVGMLPQDELARRMGMAEVFVLPTYSEGLPRVVLEAMAVGLPVIATAVAGIPEVIEDGVTGFLIPPGDEEALAERLRWLLSDTDKARDMGRRARAFAERFFSTRAYVQNYAGLFQQALESE